MLFDAEQMAQMSTPLSSSRVKFPVRGDVLLSTRKF